MNEIPSRGRFLKQVLTLMILNHPGYHHVTRPRMMNS